MMKMLIGLAVGDVAGIKIHHGTKHKLGPGGGGRAIAEFY